LDSATLRDLVMSLLETSLKVLKNIFPVSDSACFSFMVMHLFVLLC
jgi:hypothetical protein